MWHSKCQHTPAFVSIRQQTYAIRFHIHATEPDEAFKMSAYASVLQHTSADVSIFDFIYVPPSQMRHSKCQQTPSMPSAHVSICQHIQCHIYSTEPDEAFNICIQTLKIEGSIL